MKETFWKGMSNTVFKLNVLNKFQVQNITSSDYLKSRCFTSKCCMIESALKFPVALKNWLKKEHYSLVQCHLECYVLQ
uniref:Uncharacterized protein n=1 Tax=Anguilla anguilla TaxID=7936 RepID=A0A0E9XAN3_ANGAN